MARQYDDEEQRRREDEEAADAINAVDPVPESQAPAASASGLTRDAAYQEYSDYIDSIGGTMNAEVVNDFNNLWRSSAENSVYAGAGLDNAVPWAQGFEGFKPRLQLRWQEEQGQDLYDDSGRYYGPGSGGGSGGGGNSATSQYTGGGGVGVPGAGDAALAAFLEYLKGERDKSDAHQNELRAMLMRQLDTLDNPVSLEDPGIRESVTANRNALQRGTEAQRREIAERRAYDESGGVGSQGYQTDVDRLLQQRGEAGAQFEGAILFQEMQARREQLTGLLAQAMALGDAETARLIQTELAAINSQLQQSNFYDTMGLSYAQLEQGLNSDWLAFIERFMPT